MTSNINKMYAIYDNKTEAFNAPFFAPTDGAATRMIHDALADPNSQLARHPADFNLFHVGEFHFQTGEIRPVMPRNLGLMTEWLPKPMETPLLKVMEGGR